MIDRAHYDADYGQQPAEIFYDSYVGWYQYINPGVSTRVERCYNLSALPTRPGYLFEGYTNYSGESCCSADGTLCAPPIPLANGSFVTSTLYSNWTQASWNLNFNVQGGTSVGTVYIAKDGSGVYSNFVLTTKIYSIQPPTKSGNVFCGFFSQLNGKGSKLVDEDGSFTAAFWSLSISGNLTVYAYWKPIYTVTIDANGGSGGSDVFYAYEGRFYADYGLTVEITSIIPHVKQDGRLLGYNDSGMIGTYVIASDGAINPEFAPTSSTTLIAVWRMTYTVTFDKAGGDGGEVGLDFDSETGLYYAKSTGEPVTRIARPKLECFRFLGYYSEVSGGVQYIDSNGLLTQALISLVPQHGMTIFAHWQLVSYKLTFDFCGGDSGTAEIYYSDAWYYDDQCTKPLVRLTVPHKIGHRFVGYYTQQAGGSQLVNADGVPVGVLTANATAYAQWSLGVYTITFLASGGTVAPGSKQVTYGDLIGELPTPSRSGAAFIAWRINGREITTDSVYDFDGDTTAVALWDITFNVITDYFNLSCDAIVPVSSTSGDNRKRVCVANAQWNGDVQTGGAGRYDTDVSETSGVWRNPEVTYEIVNDCTVNITLGKAFPGNQSTSGYMITAVQIVTAIGKFPQLKVSAVANEGVDAVNLFSVNVPVSGRARAQNLLGAIFGGGQMQNSTLVASCTPVVLAENNMPCASDVVAGVINVSADLYQPMNGSLPMASNGFVEVGEPKQCKAKDYLLWKLNVRKEVA